MVAGFRGAPAVGAEVVVCALRGAAGPVSRRKEVERRAKDSRRPADT